MLPTHEETINQLERVLASELFASTNRLSRFLRFAVERSLAGESERLKEYVIGIEVFDRDEHYDPRVDSIVRVEAGRLRTRLQQYYHGPGRNDAIMIRLQKGAYAPVFEWRSSEVAASLPAPSAPSEEVLITSSAAQPSSPAPVDATSSETGVPLPRRTRWLPITALLAVLAISAAIALSIRWHSPAPANAVAVLPFEPHSSALEDAKIATQITEGITAALVRRGGFAVVPSRNARQAVADGSVQNIASRLHARWLLEGRVEHDGWSLRVEVRITDPERNRKIGVETFAGSVTDLDELCRRIAAHAATMLHKSD